MSESETRPMYGPAVLSRVGFSPGNVMAHSTDDTRLCFPWSGRGPSLNAFGCVHGGVLATLGDVCTTVHLWAVDRGATHVSVAFDVQFFEPAKEGTEFLCITRVVRRGKTLAFTEFEFAERLSGKVIAKGSHTKAMINK